MIERARSPLRFLAPIALIAATLIVYVVVTGSVGGGEEEPTATNSAVQRLEGDREKKPDSSEPETYEIQSGDTLDAIAADTGVSAEKIEKLNPDLDPQALIAGQELTLRE
ncbi:MAG: LysM peptidoglycan-binding domain-containing protein [Thermoleophilaceae bacterium]